MVVMLYIHIGDHSFEERFTCSLKLLFTLFMRQISSCCISRMFYDNFKLLIVHVIICTIFCNVNDTLQFIFLPFFSLYELEALLEIPC